MNMIITCFVLMACGTLPLVCSILFYQESENSYTFRPLRPEHPPKTISECNTVMTEPYGLLEQTYTRGQVKEDANCSWTLHAPANHVVNIVSVTLDLLDDICGETPSPYSLGGRVDFFDGAVPSEFPLAQFNSRRHNEYFVKSISSKQDMLVRINYHDVRGYRTQRIAVRYEFLNVDDVNRLLRAH